MTTETAQLKVHGLTVDVVRKPIKNLHLGVYPPHGRVRVAAPEAVSDSAIRLAVVGKLGWIKRQRARFEAQSRQSEREMVNGETHHFLGQRYRLRIVERYERNEVRLGGNGWLEVVVRPGLTAAKREAVLGKWYRVQLSALAQPLVAKWEDVLGVRASHCGIKKMKTKWGSCNTESGRIWLNLELAKKPHQCLEYIVVHELAHLLERTHNERFTSIMDKALPTWRSHRSELNRAPLAHETWTY